MIRVSRKFIQEIKMAGRPAYRIAQEAGLKDPTVVSKLIHGIGKVWPNDRRVLAIGEILGLAPEECFEKIPGSENKTLLGGE